VIIENAVTWILEQTNSYFDANETKFLYNRPVISNTLAEKVNAIKVLTDVLPTLNNLGYKVKQSNVNDLISKFGLELESNQAGLEFVDVNIKPMQVSPADITIKPVAPVLPATRSIDQDTLNTVYAKYKDSVNMSYSQLLAWSQNPVSKLASLTRDPINHNLELLDTKKSDWTDKHISWANSSISFIGRMSKSPNGQNTIKLNGTDTNHTKRDISLKNWAFDPDL
jgi:hypothetical protein